MPQITSPRLPGVPLLENGATGPSYSRWRRSLKFALETKGTWKYCNGQCPMPMPEAGPNALPPSMQTSKPQPSLLEERRAWVRQDREVKLDIFLSLTDEVMQEVFEIGPPLPPSSLNAREMIKALDSQYLHFQFEPYHHAFCHFLNLHVDRFPSLEQFNKEFSAVLEDLLDHRRPLSNAQACTAYFSKLGCTQNPWVAQALQRWGTQKSEPELVDLMREAEAWTQQSQYAVYKPVQSIGVEGIPEEPLGISSANSDSDDASAPSVSSRMSSTTFHSRHTSSTSQEITIHVSTKEIAEIDPVAASKEMAHLTESAVPESSSLKDQVNGTSQDAVEIPAELPAELPEWLSARKSIARPHPSVMMNRPLPPLPQQIATEKSPDPRSSSNTSLASTARTEHSLKLETTRSQASISTSQLPLLRLETTHPTLRPRTPTPPLLSEHPAFRTAVSDLIGPEDKVLTETHPALRSRSASPPGLHDSVEKLSIQEEFLQTSPIQVRTSTPLPQLPALDTPSPNIAIPWPYTPDVSTPPRHSTIDILPVLEASRPVSPYPPPPQEEQVSEPAINSTDDSPNLQPIQSRSGSAASSVISLPLQGARDSAWDYLYSRRTSHAYPPREHSVSPIELSAPIRHHTDPPRSSPSPLPWVQQQQRTVTPPLNTHVHALQQLRDTLSKTSLPSLNRPSTASSSHMFGAPHANGSTSSFNPRSKVHAKSTSADFVARLSGDSLFESSEEIRERERDEEEGRKKRERKRKGLSLGVGLGRLGLKVKE